MLTFHVPYLTIWVQHSDVLPGLFWLTIQGTLRVLLVLLHDFPEFLCDYHYGFCDVIPPNCIQLRNLILSAFPRNMRLPDPFTPNLKVEADSLRAVLSNRRSKLLREWWIWAKFIWRLTNVVSLPLIDSCCRWTCWVRSTLLPASSPTSQASCLPSSRRIWTRIWRRAHLWLSCLNFAVTCR